MPIKMVSHVFLCCYFRLHTCTALMHVLFSFFLFSWVFSFKMLEWRRPSRLLFFLDRLREVKKMRQIFSLEALRGGEKESVRFRRRCRRERAIMALRVLHRRWTIAANQCLLCACECVCFYFLSPPHSVVKESRHIHTQTRKGKVLSLSPPRS
jgi:hypothetical protein